MPLTTIVYSVNKLAQFMDCATDVLWQAVKRLLRYIHATTNIGLFIFQEFYLETSLFFR